MSLSRSSWLVAVLTVVAPLDARADQTKSSCVEGHVRGQQLRIEGDLDAARSKLRMCSNEACPAIIRRDCVTWLREVEAQVPTVVFAARDPSGHDLVDVRVFVDGRLVQERLTGEAVELRAGERRVRFEGGQGAAVETKVIAALGEKNRVVRLTMDAPSGRGPESDAMRIAPFALGGVGLVAATTGLVLDLVASADLQRLRDPEQGCAPYCSTEEVDDVKTRMIVGDALLGVGIVAIGAAALWLVVRAPSPGAKPAAAGQARSLPVARHAWMGGL